jgi:peptide/nickel transport system substrate-binding protein
VTANGDYEATFHLKRPQPALLTLLASGWSPIYPCHAPPVEMRRHPIGTGPFKFVEFKPNEAIKLVRNPDYWKPGRPYLDGIEYTIIANRSTRILAFVAEKFDMTFPFNVTIPLLKDVQSQAPQAICKLVPANSPARLAGDVSRSTWFEARHPKEKQCRVTGFRLRVSCQSPRRTRNGARGLVHGSG